LSLKHWLKHPARGHHERDLLVEEARVARGGRQRRGGTGVRARERGGSGAAEHQRQAKDNGGTHACGAVLVWRSCRVCLSRPLRFRSDAHRMRGSMRRAEVKYKHARTRGQTAQCASGRPGKAKSTAANCACSCLRPTSRTRGRRCSCARTCTTFAPSAAVLTFVQHALHAIGLL